MRVIAGAAKGTRLAAVPAGVRPLSDRAREGFFSSLGESVEGARVLDLFAGTGAVGIEALSRGAASAVFMDSSPAAVETIEENLRRAKLGSSARVVRGDAFRGLPLGMGPYDVLFVDPPYRVPSAAVVSLLETARHRDSAGPGAVAVLTRPARGYTPVIPVKWDLHKLLGYGDTLILVLKAR